jgi:uracil-DNA glycosylase
MVTKTGAAAELILQNATLDVLRRKAADCKACDLWTRATQTVFGDGEQQSGVMLIGEQPGDAEDIAGKPFVGPAGKQLDRALQEAGIDRDKPTSRTRSSTSTGARREGSGAFTRSRTPVKWRPASRGSRRRSACYGRA